MSAHSQTLSIYRGEDADLDFVGAGDDDPTGWALLATLSEYAGQDPVTLSTTSVTVSGASAPYTLTVSLDRDETSELTGDRYVMDVWRTDTGNNVNLATAIIPVLTPVRLPASP